MANIFETTPTVQKKELLFINQNVCLKITNDEKSERVVNIEQDGPLDEKVNKYEHTEKMRTQENTC